MMAKLMRGGEMELYAKYSAGRVLPLLKSASQPQQRHDFVRGNERLGNLQYSFNQRDRDADEVVALILEGMSVLRSGLKEVEMDIQGMPDLCHWHT